MKKKREEHQAIMNRMNLLYAREAAGEDVTAELRECGRELEALSNKPRVNVKPSRVTREMKQLAASRGISNYTLDYRIYTLQWDIERAVSEPITRRNNPYEVGLTVENYKHLKAVGMLDADIRRKYNISQHMMHKFKQENGLQIRTWKRKKEAQ